MILNDRFIDGNLDYLTVIKAGDKKTHITEAGPVGESDNIMEPILKVFRAKILTDLIGQHVRAYLTGSAEMVSWGMTKGGRPILYEGPPISQAIDYAQKHCAQLVTKMDEESKRLIAQTVSDGIKNKRGVEGLARDIRKQFEDMTKYRSQLIAKTETADALEQGFMDRAEAMGINGKEWVTTGDDKVSDGCAENEAAGVIPLNDEFPADSTSPEGKQRPPRFPGCRCALAPVMIKD